MKLKFSKTKIHDLSEFKKPNVSKENRAGEGRSTISYIIYFFLIVFIFIIISLIARFIFLLQKSTFNPISYSVFINSDNPRIIVLNNDLKQMWVVKVPNISSSRIRESIVLGVPIDGRVKNENITSNNFSSIPIILDQIFAPWKYAYEDMTVLDGMRMAASSYSLSKKDISSSEIKVSKDGDLVGITQDQLYTIFKDPKIIDEQKSIEIVNATAVTGLAGSVGRVIKNVGGNVVSITSGDKRPRTTVTGQVKSETLTRIARLLGAQEIVDENLSSLADIQVIVGSDFGNKL